MPSLAASPALAARLADVANPAHAVLTAIGRLAGTAQRDGLIDGFARLRLETTLVDLANAQGGLERIRNTPLPVHYTVFPSLFARVFCVLLPFAVVDDLGLFTPVGSTLVSLMFLMALQIGRDLGEPFADGVHAVTTQAICRTIEIDRLRSARRAQSRPCGRRWAGWRRTSGARRAPQSTS